MSWDPAHFIKPENEDQTQGVRDLLVSAFGGTLEADLVDALRHSTAYLRPLTLIAEMHAEVIGFVMMSLATVGLGDQRLGVLALAPLAVDAEHRCRGIGTALVQAVHERARVLGYPAAFVVGDPAYYGRFGYTPASGFGITAPFDVSDEAFMALELAPGGLLGCAGALRYAEPFGTTTAAEAAES